MLKRCIIAENRKLHASPIWVIFFVLPLISAGVRDIQLSAKSGNPDRAVVQPVDAAHAVLLDAVLSRAGVGVCGLPLAA